LAALTMDQPLLTALIFTPMLGAIFLGFLPSEERTVQRAALVFSLVPFVLSLVVLALFDPARADFQMIERHAWLPDFAVHYLLGSDGVSLLLVLLTTLLTVLVVLASFGAIPERVRACT